MNNIVHLYGKILDLAMSVKYVTIRIFNMMVHVVLLLIEFKIAYNI